MNLHSYQSLAKFYDRFTTDVDYPRWVGFFETIFQKEHWHPHTILDLACGTGSISRLLCQRGYDVIAVDASTEMLTVAYANTADLPHPPFFIAQRMETLKLHHPVDVCLCCLDSVNYVIDPILLQEAFCRVYRSLNEGGLFIFDINTPYHFQIIDGACYVREDEDVHCTWQCEVEDGICYYDFTIFEKQTNRCWIRSDETHAQRIYPPEPLLQMLQTAGFSSITIYPYLHFGKISPTESRLFFVAKKEIS